MNALETKIGELTAWRTSFVRVVASEPAGTGMPRIEIAGTCSPVLKFPELVKASDYEIERVAVQEPEFQAAWTKVQEAVQGLHDAREVIIQRKALELANLIHGDKLNGIRALVDQIQGGAES